MTDPEDKYKRSKRRADDRRKNQRDALPKIKEDTKFKKKLDKNEYENDDGEVP